MVRWRLAPPGGEASRDRGLRSILAKHTPGGQTVRDDGRDQNASTLANWATFINIRKQTVESQYYGHKMRLFSHSGTHACTRTHSQPATAYTPTHLMPSQAPPRPPPRSQPPLPPAPPPPATPRRSSSPARSRYVSRSRSRTLSRSASRVRSASRDSWGLRSAAGAAATRSPRGSSRHEPPLPPLPGCSCEPPDDGCGSGGPRRSRSLSQCRPRSCSRSRSPSMCGARSTRGGSGRLPSPPPCPCPWPVGSGRLSRCCSWP